MSKPGFSFLNVSTYFTVTIRPTTDVLRKRGHPVLVANYGGDLRGRHGIVRPGVVVSGLINAMALQIGCVFNSARQR